MIDWTRVRLANWGRWCRGGISTGLPKSSAFVHAGEGARGLDGGAYIPPDVEEIERIVARMSSSLRQPIIIMYTKRGPLWLKAAQMHVSRRTFRRRLQTGEEWVARQLRIEGYVN